MSEEERDEIKAKSPPASGETEVAVGSGSEEEPSPVELPDSLPVLPLKNTVLYPFLLSPLLVNTDRSRKLIDEVLLTPHRLLVCASVRKPVEDNRLGPGVKQQLACLPDQPCLLCSSSWYILTI